MAGRTIKRGKGPGRRNPKGKSPVPAVVQVSGEEEVFGVLASKFLRGTLSTGDPEWTMFYFSKSWREGLPKEDATRGLFDIGPYLFVTRFQKLVDGLNRKGFVWAVEWLKKNFSYDDWKRAVKWCGVAEILSLFASREPPDEGGAIHSKLQGYVSDSQERDSLCFGWLLKILKYEKAHGKLGGLENNETLTRKDVVDEFKGLTWLKKQEFQGQEVEWRWLVRLLETARVKSDIVISACYNASAVAADPKAKSRIWSAYATVHGVLSQLPPPWDIPAGADEVSDAYRLWWLGRAIACETKRMLVRAGNPTSVETRKVHYEYQGQPLTFQAVKGDLTRKDVDSYHEKLVKEVGLLLSDVYVDGQPVDEVIRDLQRKGDQCDLYNNLVVPGKAATSGWSDYGKLASSSFANYLSEGERLVLIKASGELVLMATETRTAGKVGRAREILHILAGKKADPAELIAAKDYVAGDISKGQKDRLLSPFLGGILSALSGLKGGRSPSGGAGGGTGVSSSSGGYQGLPSAVGAATHSIFAKLGHNIQNFFEENIFWISVVSLFPFFFWWVDLAFVPAAIATAVCWWLVLKPISMTRLWWVSTLMVVFAILMTVGLSQHWPLVQVPCAALRGWLERLGWSSTEYLDFSEPAIPPD